MSVHQFERWPVDLVLFDLDGTLIDSAHDIGLCVNETLRRIGKPTIDERVIYGFVGRGVIPLIEQALEEVAPSGGRRGPETQAAIRLFLDLYQEHSLDHTKLYPGVSKLLEAYSGKALAVVTNKAERFTWPILKGLGVRDRFRWVLGGDSVKEKKPHPGPILHVLEAAGVSPHRAVFVGDSAIDIEAGKAAGTLTCGVLYGLRPESEIREAAPDAIVETAIEIRDRFF
ncbi:MAG: phosphoglycolate phosphatase [Deltaproteobacteria bacterium RBG_13_65_10]|nr:MAG: phosphoglycolate phosphatase [Deltaproteobacteria bacterium RBG_13_65_10]